MSRIARRSSFVTGASSSVEKRSASSGGRASPKSRGECEIFAGHVIDDSEFPETDLRFAMQCFDMAKVRVGMADGGELALIYYCVALNLWQRYWWLTRIWLSYSTGIRDGTQFLERVTVQKGRPLANASNCQVWEEILSKHFHTTCEPARQPLRVMPLLVRF